MSWGIRYGRWWAVQWAFDGWISLGIHLDLRCRPHAVVGSYGPYVDIHLLFLVISFGNNPAYSGEIDLLLSTSRGGKS